MKSKSAKRKNQPRFDPIDFAASVPTRKPTPSDTKAVRSHANDQIEPKLFKTFKASID